MDERIDPVLGAESPKKGKNALTKVNGPETICAILDRFRRHFRALREGRSVNTAFQSSTISYPSEPHYIRLQVMNH
ncbi:hypothetical protein J2Y48_000324 [Mycoplana sp. BE70]|uniref:hypothetical protein n=1 Tax=Mycoplana sp. BE70 TaxID=2817775 RepID=UPI00285C022A|nr:hypothetical protein [Mycoplana sp. BE70]MDR6755051.1 hypothetical protein [Mycoplana sp. BE70]